MSDDSQKPAATNAADMRNTPEFSVSDLAFSLKKTLEDSYDHVRVRGELSRVKRHSSGHIYSDLKDEKSVINVVCWRGVAAKLSVEPEEGLEVICTGRVSTYPARSNYQLVIESIELAGEGALLKMLEERRKNLAAEGLFDEARKQPLPFLPARIGIVTSPTGAVIRDILHRLSDRFPRNVLLWPVRVQGDTAAAEVSAAIEGFNALQAGENGLRPDLLIVARGGGSLEDLMAFNEENVVRAIAASEIPVISAVGHETDTTLADFAADRRAPTPTGAAEIAVPVRIDMIAQVNEDAHRLFSSMRRIISDFKNRLETQEARLGKPSQILESRAQTLDFLGERMIKGFEKTLTAKKSRISELGAGIKHPRQQIAEAKRLLSYHQHQLARCAPLITKEPGRRLEQAGRLLETLSFKSVLARGFVVVRDEEGKPVTKTAATSKNQPVELEFSDGRRAAIIHDNPGAGGSAVSKGKPADKSNKAPPRGQGDLF